jgi:hypothetical protein
MNPSFALLLTLALATPSGGAQLDWKEFAPKDGGFTILMPGAPTEHKKSIKLATGIVEVVVYELPIPPGDGKFVVGYSEFPEATIKPGTEDKRLDNARDGVVASVKGTLLRQKILLLDSYPGRELHIKTDGKTTVVVRLCAVNNRLYQLLVVGNEELAASPEAAKFMTSFKLAR